MRGSDGTATNNGQGGERYVSTDAGRKVWERPVLTLHGNVQELVLAIGGKASVTPGDPQENRKVRAT